MDTSDELLLPPVGDYFPADAKYTNSQVVRSNIRWKSIEPNAPVNGQHCYKWAAHHGAINTLLAKGIPTVGFIGSSPVGKRKLRRLVPPLEWHAISAERVRGRVCEICRRGRDVGEQRHHFLRRCQPHAQGQRSAAATRPRIRSFPTSSVAGRCLGRSSSKNEVVGSLEIFQLAVLPRPCRLPRLVT
jgi:hypothetical protein